MRAVADLESGVQPLAHKRSRKIWVATPLSVTLVASWWVV